MTDKKVSEKIRERIQAVGARYYANDNIGDFVYDSELNQLLDEVTAEMQSVLNALVIDTKNDHNTQETARRVAKMFVQEIFSGRYQKRPRITAFPNATSYDQLYVTGPITIRSMCAHHMMPIVGRAYIGVFPGKNVIGLSKFNRITDWIASRPQIQEEMTVQLADEVEAITGADGIAVLVRAEHFCMSHRGVKEHASDMSTSIVRGSLRENPALKQEFFSIVAGMKGQGNS
jgi:GTP cyclohydrolase IA